jgi:hypothetical protein
MPWFAFPVKDNLVEEARILREAGRKCHKTSQRRGPLVGWRRSRWAGSLADLASGSGFPALG